MPKEGRKGKREGEREGGRKIKVGPVETLNLTSNLQEIPGTEKHVK